MHINNGMLVRLENKRASTSKINYTTRIANKAFVIEGWVLVYMSFGTNLVCVLLKNILAQHSTLFNLKCKFYLRGNQ